MKLFRNIPMVKIRMDRWNKNAKIIQINTYMNKIENEME